MAEKLYVFPSFLDFRQVSGVKMPGKTEICNHFEI